MATLATDAVALAASACLVLLVAPAAARTSPAAVAAYPAVVLVLLALLGRYRPRWSRPLSEELRDSLATSAVGVIALSAACLLVRGEPLVGVETLWLWSAAAASLAAAHLVLAVIVWRARRLGTFSSPTLIVGAGRVGHLVARRLLERPELGLAPIGFLDKDPLAKADRATDLPVFGSSRELEAVVREHDVERVIIAFSTAPDELLLSVARRCGAIGVGVSIVPRLFEVEGTRPSAVRLGGVPLVELPFDDPARFGLRVKYAVDRVVAGAVWLALSPLLAGVAVAVRLTMGRPILHRQERVGRDGRVFEMLKFRTMTGRPDRDGEADAAWLRSVVREGDGQPGGAAGIGTVDRTTSLGRMLRRWSLDELPQLWNVVRGDMSLVGPRPERVSYVDRLQPVIYRYQERHRVKPGITGWAQVNGLRGRTSLDDRIEWDNYYVENWGWGLDLSILARTVASVLRGAQDDVSARPARARADVRPSRALARIFGLFVVCVAALALAPAAFGQSGSNVPAADQYVEDVPTAGGARPAGGKDGGAGTGSKGSKDSSSSSSGSGGSGSGGSGSGGGGSTGGASGSGSAAGSSTGSGASVDTLSPKAAGALRKDGGSSARKLRAIATSPALGAPQRALPSEAARPASPSAAGAALEALGGSNGGNQLVWLVIAMGATGLVAGAAALNERRRARGSGG
jgi:exopolysaccharide biosynthesis polyprenyl glycosylphosphotransferase